MPQLRLMISSRSNTEVFGATRLTDIRLRLKEAIRSIRWTGVMAKGSSASMIGDDESLFEVWIHEPEAGEPVDESTFELSLRKVREQDLVLVLYSGEAGWVSKDRDIGICHAEALEAIARRGKVTPVFELTPVIEPKTDADHRFAAYLKRQHAFTKTCNSEAELQRAVLECIRDRVLELAHEGGQQLVRRDRGAALDWESLTLIPRRAQMCAALRDALRSDPVAEPGVLPADLGGVRYTLRIDAVPDAMSVAAARELVGQPHLRDHERASQIGDDAPGIIHLIGCHRGVTRTQATRLIGTPDAIAIESEFGVLAVDVATQNQYILLRHCADADSIRSRITQLDQWLLSSEFGRKLEQRAATRVQLLRLMAEVQQGLGY